MLQRSYLDFEVRIAEKSHRSYQVTVINSPTGEAQGEFNLPFNDVELERFVFTIQRTVLRSQATTRRIEPPELQAIRSFGAKLFDAVFEKDIRSRYFASLALTHKSQCGMRLKLRIEAPELAFLPWEYLYDTERRSFVSLSTGTPIVRYIELPYRSDPVIVSPPLQILVMISAPKDYPPLDIEGERQKILSALNDLIHSKNASVEFLEGGGLDDLQGLLRKHSFHVFHYVGHGAFDEIAEDGRILVEDEQGSGISVSGTVLGNLLQDHFSLRLVVLNTCEGARSSRTDPFASVATSLVQTGIPCVVAMQFEVTDQAAIAFSKEFYRAIADNYPIDAAVSEARKAMNYSVLNNVEWGTPVLYMRAQDGMIFDISPDVQPETTENTSDGTSVAMSSSEPNKKVGIEFNKETGDLLVDGREVFLSRIEVELMRVLYEKANLTCSKELIADLVWSTSGGVSDEMITKAVNRLRRKIGWQRVVTVPGRGYKLVL